MNDKMRTLTIPELLVHKYLTEQIPEFRTIHKKYEKTFKANRLRGLTDELVVRFLLIFVRNHSSIWMRFRDEPLSNLFSTEEWTATCEYWRNDNYTISIFVLDRWLSRRFRQSLTKEEMEVLVTDFEKCLNDARELIISAGLSYKAIRKALKSRELLGEEIIKFLDSNKEDKEPLAYERSVNFLSRLPSDIQKSLGDALVVERNYLSRQGLFAHLQRIEEAILGKYFLDTLKTHASRLARAVGERGNERISWAYEIYYSILGKFKRQPKAHFEHYLNATLLGERKYALSDREKIVYRDDTTCPFCGYGLGEILKGKTSGSIECPSCHVSVGVWAFQNDLVPMSELPESFFRDPLDSKGPTYRVKTFAPTMGEYDFSDLLDQFLIVNPVLTNKEMEIVDAIREADGEGISMSEVLRRIASEQGKSPHTVTEHWKNAKKKLKKLAKKSK